MTEWHTWDEVSAELGDARSAAPRNRRSGSSSCAVSWCCDGWWSSASGPGCARSAVATIDLLARYLDAVGGRLEITAAFDGGTERVVLNWPAA